MPTRNGTPFEVSPKSPGYVAAGHPVNWVDIGGQESLGVQQVSAMRGQPAFTSWWHKRPRWGPQSIPQAAPFYTHNQPYSRGAAAYAPHFGQLAYNPIGAGIYSPYKLPPCAGPGATYVAGAIWFDVQTAPTSMRFNRTVPIETVNALIATSHVSAGYLGS